MEPRPVRATILYALLSGILFLPFYILSAEFLGRAFGFRLTLWICVAGYGWILARQAKANLTGAVIPLLVLLAFVFYPNPPFVFAILAMGVLSWIRSGVCYPKALLPMLMAEGITCGGAAFLLVAFPPGSTPVWALSIWLFFLFQSLYFLIFETAHERSPETVADPFDRAKNRAEEILSGDLFNA